MWIMITKKLPVKPSPPKLSIHWAEMAINEPRLLEQRRWLEEWADEPGRWQLRDKDYFVDSLGAGFIPNEAKTVRINYGGQSIRVLGGEYSVLTPESMRLYVYGDNLGMPSHEFVPNVQADSLLLQAAMETDLRSIYDAALIDGCTPEMARDVAFGIDVTQAIEFPPIGWYRCVPQYATIYCHDYELTEV